jgi:hypothetical protein
MPDPITAVVGGGAVLGLMGAQGQADATKSAAETQAGAAREGQAAQLAQMEEVRRLLAPYTNAGPGALSQMQGIAGLGAPGAQAAAYRGIEQSPGFQTMARQGEEGILQNASATGGLRGGNVQAALGQFRPQLLNQFVNQQYERLAGITSLGQQSAAGVGTAGMQTGSNVANLMQQQGAAQAGGILGQAGANQQMMNVIPQSLGLYRGLGGSFGGQSPIGQQQFLGSNAPTLSQGISSADLYTAF